MKHKTKIRKKPCLNIYSDGDKMIRNALKQATKTKPDIDYDQARTALQTAIDRSMDRGYSGMGGFGGYGGISAHAQVGNYYAETDQFFVELYFRQRLA